MQARGKMINSNDFKFFFLPAVLFLTQVACNPFPQKYFKSGTPQSFIEEGEVNENQNLLSLLVEKEGIEKVQKVDLATIPHGEENGIHFVAYGTFQSHYQKVVSTKNGIFAAFLASYVADSSDSRNDMGAWEIVKSVDGGQTFQTVYSLETSSKTPCLEADAEGNLHLAYASNRWNDLIYSKLQASENYSQLHSVTVPGAGAGKYSCAISDKGKVFVYLGWEQLVRFDLQNMQVLDSRTYFKSGPNGHPQYPHLVFQPEKNYLLAAWTTISVNDINGRPNYRDIRYAVSYDFGLSWKSTTTSENLILPIIADETGGTATPILSSDYINTIQSQEQGVPWENWLDSATFVGNYLYFAYFNTGENNSDYQTRFVRSGLYHNDGAKPVVLERFKGETIELNSNGLYFTTHTLPDIGTVIYAVGSTSKYELASLYSEDKGVTWHDHAISEPENHQPYAITGSKTVTAEGDIIGEYTSFPQLGEHEGKVKFFKIKGRVKAMP